MVQIQSGKQDSNMGHSFSNVPQANINRSTFKRIHTHKTTFDADYLVPIYTDETLPGDTFQMDASFFARLSSPLKTPIMDNMYLDTFFFAVPKRILWDNYEKFMGAQTDPGDSTQFLVPITPAASGGYLDRGLEDYFGMPLAVENISMVSFWHRAYNMIYNEWFRDQNLQNSSTVDLDDGPDLALDYPLLKRGKRHDYFTSALPWPQKSDDGAVTIPLGGSAPITGFAKINQTFVASAQTGYETDGSGTVSYNPHIVVDGGTSNQQMIVEEDPSNTGFPNMRADLSNATTTTINDLREAFATQQLYETDARGGTRFTEQIQAHFGVTNPDSRMQRPELLSSSSHGVGITAIAQTSQTSTTEQGTLTSVGTIQATTSFTKSFTEPCVIIGLVNIRADLTYQDGIHRMYSKRDRFDNYFPALAHIGEQAILVQEIYAVNGTTDTGSTGTPDNERTFGFIPRWDEYRYSKSLITGEFRSNDAASLDTWHLSQDFSAAPALNSTFIQSATPIARVIAVTSQSQFILDSFFRENTTRPIPTFSTPGMAKL